MDGAPIVDAAVRVRGDRIVEVGTRAQIGTADEEIVDLHDHILLPGLINAHCHLDYTGLRGRIPRPDSFADWIRAINAEKATLTSQDYLRVIAAGAAEALRFGTTTLVNLEAFPDLIAQSGSFPLRVWWCPELIDVAAPAKGEQIVSAAVRALATVEHGGLAPHALFTASGDLYRQCEQIASADDFLLTTHLAESREEMEMFRDGSGALFEFLRSIGRSMQDCGGATPVEVFHRVRHEAQRDPSTSVGMTWIVAHLNEVAESDFALLEQMPPNFSVAHCPRSHAYFGHRDFAFEKLEAIGINVCLATDSLASNDDLSLLAEIRAFRDSYPHVSAERALGMVTVNPAKALGASDQLGKISAGFLADMIALPMNGSDNFYEMAAGFGGAVPWLMVGGKIQMFEGQPPL